MRFLIDNALSNSMAEGLKKAGHDAVHVRELGMGMASDKEIMEFALKENRVIVSADTDFGTLLALYDLSKPSFILFRKSDKRPIALLMQLLAFTSMKPKCPSPQKRQGTQILTRPFQIQLRPINLPLDRVDQNSELCHFSWHSLPSDYI